MNTIDFQYLQPLHPAITLLTLFYLPKTFHLPSLSIDLLHSHKNQGCITRLDLLLLFQWQNTRGGHTVNIGQELVRRGEEETRAPRETRRLNQNLLKLVVDLRVSSKCMKWKGKSSKGKTLAFLSIPNSPPSIHKSYGTALTFSSPKFSGRFQKLMVNKNIYCLW